MCLHSFWWNRSLTIVMEETKVVHVYDFYRPDSNVFLLHGVPIMHLAYWAVGLHLVGGDNDIYMPVLSNERMTTAWLTSITEKDITTDLTFSRIKPAGHVNSIQHHRLAQTSQFCKMSAKNWRFLIDHVVSSFNQSANVESEKLSIVHLY